MRRGYNIHLLGVCAYGGVKTRRFLNAPVSMDFNHTLRSYMTRESLDLRSLARIDSGFDTTLFEISISISIGNRFYAWRKAVDSSEIEHAAATNWHLNKMAQELIDFASKPARAILMQEYNRQTIHCYTRNRERFLTYE